MDRIKSGIKTSEFWMALLGALLPVVNQQLGTHIPTDIVLGTSGTIISYILGRSWVKGHVK